MHGIETVDVGLLLLRLLACVVFVIHAAQKLAGWFSGGGVRGTAVAFERMGQRPGRQMVVMAGCCELAAGLLLGAGVVMPLGVVVGLGTMLVAGGALTTLNGTPWNAKGGGEYPFFIAAVLAAASLVGPGRLSVDAAMGMPWLEAGLASDPWVASGAVAVAVLVSLPPLLRGRAILRAESSSR